MLEAGEQTAHQIEQELARFRNDNREPRERRKILRKTSAIFSKHRK